MMACVVGHKSARTTLPSSTPYLASTNECHLKTVIVDWFIVKTNQIICVMWTIVLNGIRLVNRGDVVY